MNASWLLMAACALTVAPDLEKDRYDLVIYGGTSAGIGAAVQGARMTRSVVLVAPETHLGGLTSGGLGWTDSGQKGAIGGLARDFYRRIKTHYDRPDAWRQQKADDYRLYHKSDEAIWAFEPRAAERAFEELVANYPIRVERGQKLDREHGVTKKGTAIDAIRTISGQTYRGRVFIDATYEGDLMAAAGVAYVVGREPNARYNETLNGVETSRAVSHQFDRPVDPYKTPGDPSSGLLPRVHAGPPGVEGEGDRRVQAYCFRVCLTDAPENRIRFAKPEGYDPGQYEILGRYLRAGGKQGFGKFDPVPNRKTDTNNHGPFSTDNIGMSDDYPEATYERRAEIIAEHERYQKGLFYYMANDPGVPAEVRERMSRWGLAADEFNDNGHWPHQIYVREARRMVSDFVMTERHLRAIEPTPEPIGMGSYNMDSHNVQRYVDALGHVRNEGDFQVSPGGAYPISYRAVVPKAGACTNLLVPVCLSSSHVAYGSIRMEPVFIILGQSVASAAAVAIEDRVSVQDVDYAKLRARLLADGQVLDLPRQTEPKGLSAKDLPGVLIDDDKAELTGEWVRGSVIGPYVGEGYRHDGDSGKGAKSATFRATLEPGRYEVRVFYPANPNRSTDVPVLIRHAGGETRQTLNQRKAPEGESPSASVGTYAFDGPAVVEVNNAGTHGYVIVDAVQFIKVDRTH